MFCIWQYTSWTNKAIKLLQLPKKQNINHYVNTNFGSQQLLLINQSGSSLLKPEFYQVDIYDKIVRKNEISNST